jgi:transposase
MNLYFGIDVGKFTHELSVVDAQGNLVKSLSFANNAFGIGLVELLAKELTSEEPQRVKFALEATGHYWIPLYEQLLRRGFQVEVINPLQSNRFRDFYIQPLKSDRRDSFVIANLLRFGQITKTQLADSRVMILRRLTRYRATLVHSLARTKNRIRTVLDECFPEYQQVPLFSIIFCKSSLALLKCYPTPEALLKLSPEELTAFLLKASSQRVGEAKARAILKAAEMSIASCWLASTWQSILADLVQELEALLERTHHVNQAIRDSLSQLPQSLTTIPGLNTIFAATIISEIGDISRFKSADQLLAYCGMIPSSRDSGTFSSRFNPMARRGNPQLNYTFYRLALVSIRFNPALKSYYQRRVEAGLPKKRALIAVARKLVRLVYILLKEGRPYLLPATGNMPVDNV